MERDDDQLFFSFMNFFSERNPSVFSKYAFSFTRFDCNLASAKKMMVVLNRFLGCSIEIIILSISLYLVSSQTG